MQWVPAYALFLFGITAITFYGALFIEKQSVSSKKKSFVVIASLLALLPLLVFKYYNFINLNVREGLRFLGFATEISGLNWAIPLGISFFTFQAVGYMLDVYYKRIDAEHDWWDYMLFVSFFPQVLTGPISKAADLLPQIKQNKPFNYEMAVAGCRIFLWGLFLKVVLADRLGLYVNAVFDNWHYNSGATCLLASFSYSFQIYGDFAGYSFMAVGVGRLLGFELVSNFNRPYLSTSITQFWRRWHISFSTWLKDYVYIPLGGSRCSIIRNYFNILITFLVSGIWHGANWTFILWGALHGFFQILEKALGLQKCETSNVWVRISRIFVTFLVVNFLWTIFRLPSFSDAYGVFSKMLAWDGSLMLPDKTPILFSVIALGMTIVSECSDEFAPNRFSLLANRSIVVRWASIVALVVIILLTGVFDCSQFIYVSF